MENKYNRKITSGISTEQLVLLVCTLYFIGMSVVALIQQWPGWISIVITVGLVLGWALSWLEVGSSKFRAYVHTFIAMIDFTIYAFMSPSLSNVLPTLCAFMILFSLTNIPEVLYMIMADTIFVILAHLMILNTIDLSTSAEIIRFTLQILSIITLEFIIFIMIKNRSSRDEAIRHTIEKLRETEQSKNDFITNISHEIRTPINTIEGMGEMLLRDDLTPEEREKVLNITQAGRILLKSVNDTIDFTELNTGKTVSEEEAYEFSSMINDVINKALAQIGPKNIQLIVDCDPFIPQTLVGDEQKIRRIILCLMENAIKFTKIGGVILTIGFRRESYGCNLVFSIKDTGIGIKDEDKDKIFSTYNQLDTGRDRHGEGIGLGLVIAKKMATLLNGFISFQSEYGNGTEFNVTIPQRIKDKSPYLSIDSPEKMRILIHCTESDADRHPMRTEKVIRFVEDFSKLGIVVRHTSSMDELKSSLMHISDFSHIFVYGLDYSINKDFFDELADRISVIIISPPRWKVTPGENVRIIYEPFYTATFVHAINDDKVLQYQDGTLVHGGGFAAPEATALIVDDNLMNIKVAESILEKYEIKAERALSGREALEKLSNTHYDLIFMDHMMPEMDGIETGRRIRQKSGDYYKNVPMIALTANGTAEARELFLTNGFQDFIAKPIDLNLMERVLKRRLPSDKIRKKDRSVNGNLNMSEAFEEVPKQPVAQIDRALGIHYSGDDAELYAELLEVFKDSIEETSEKINSCYKEKDWENYRILVHSLKSNSRGIGAQKLSEAAEAVEKACKINEITYVESHHEELMEMYDLVKQELENDK
ncbi:MAG: response regulator [Lachnospiraceae bacterium]|nr:response regulator [Lachnospiraceae bacterium]